MKCNQRGWTDEDQEFDNPCVCGLSAGHDGLHECHEGCGGTWAGGLAAVPDVEENDRG